MYSLPVFPSSPYSAISRPPQLIDFRRSVFLRADLPRRLQDQFLLRCLRDRSSARASMRFAPSGSV